MKRSFLVVPAVLLVLGCLGSPARAVTLGGRSSTQALFFSDEAGTDHFDLAQYLRATARNLDAGDTLQATGYARAAGDVQQGGGVDTRLYYLYLDKRDLPGDGAVRVGRQFFFVSAGSAVVDGAKVAVNPVKPLRVTVAGGRHVLFDASREITHGGDVAAAAQVALTGIPDLSADLSYLATYDESDKATEKVGFSAEKRFGRYGELYTRLRYDVLSEVWNEVEAGARTGIVRNLLLSAAFYRTVPTFEATSIYSVFAVERYQEASLRADYELSRKVSLEGEYRNESYGDGDTANVGEAGIRLRPTDASSVYAAGIWRNGTGGKLTGFELSGDVAVKQRFLLAAGVQHDVYRRELETGDRSASRFWVGGNVKLRKNVTASARVEDNVNENYDNDVRARLALNVDF